MSSTPSFVFIPGGWHKPSCYNKVMKILEEKHNIKCIPITLPSTLDNPNATFKDDIDAARKAIISETNQGRNVIVVAPSYGGMVGNSAIKGLTRPKPGQSSTTTTTSSSSSPPTQSQNNTNTGFVTALILIASGFTITGLAFMDPTLGLPLPFFRANKETGYAEFTADARTFFYQDVPDDEAECAASQLSTQSLKSLYEGGEHAYAGWQDVPTWYIGTIEDIGLPVAVQRVQVAAARAMGAVVHHTELQSSHSPFLSMPEEVVDVVLEAVRVVIGSEVQVEGPSETDKKTKKGVYRTPTVVLSAPTTWFKLGIPFFIGRMIGWTFAGFIGIRRLWRGK